MTEDEYSDIGLGRCILKKSTSVTKNLFEEYAVGVSVSIVLVAALVVVLIAMDSILSAIAFVAVLTWKFAVALNPLVYIAVFILLPIPAYSTIWCLRHRKQIRDKKKHEEIPVCPIGKKEV